MTINKLDLIYVLILGKECFNFKDAGYINKTVYYITNIIVLMGTGVDV